jgi:hypothetical protein
MAEIDAFFKTAAQANQARMQIDNTLQVQCSEVSLVTARNGRPYEFTIRPTGPDAALPAVETRLFNSILSVVSRFDGEIHGGPQSGSSRLVNQMPQSVIDRYEAENS